MGESIMDIGFVYVTDQCHVRMNLTFGPDWWRNIANFFVDTDNEISFAFTSFCSDSSTILKGLLHVFNQHKVVTVDTLFQIATRACPGYYAQFLSCVVYDNTCTTLCVVISVALCLSTMLCIWPPFICARRRALHDYTGHLMKYVIPIVLCHTWKLAPLGNVLHWGIMCITLTFAMQFAAMLDRTQYATTTAIAGTWCASLAYYVAMFCLKQKWSERWQKWTQVAFFVCLVAHMCCDKTGTLFCKASWLEVLMKTIVPLNMWWDKTWTSCKCDEEVKRHSGKVVKRVLCVLLLIVCIAYVF